MSQNMSQNVAMHVNVFFSSCSMMYLCLALTMGTRIHAAWEKDKTKRDSGPRMSLEKAKQLGTEFRSVTAGTRCGGGEGREGTDH